MTGASEHFCSHRGLTLLGALVALLIIQRVDGHPRSRPNFLAYDENHPLAMASSSNIGAPSSVVETFSEATEITAEMKPVDYPDPLSTYRRNPDVSGSSEIPQQDRATGLTDADTNSDESPDMEKDEEDEEDPDDTEINYDNTNHRNNMDNIEPYDNTETEHNNDDVQRLLHEAMAERIFLTPEEWESENTRPDATETKPESNDNRSIFPDQARTAYLDNVANMPVPTCKDTTFCADVPYYPSDELIENAMRINYIQPISDPAMISQRMSPPGAPQDKSLCASEPKELQPVSGEDDQQVWHYVLNNKKYVQKVNVELCLSAGGSCQIPDPVIQGYTTFCKQTHFYRHLVVISTNGTAETKPIKLPSSCCCHYKFDPSVSPRIAASLRNNLHQTPARASPKN